MKRRIGSRIRNLKVVFLKVCFCFVLFYYCYYFLVFSATLTAHGVPRLGVEMELQLSKASGVRNLLGGGQINLKEGFEQNLNPPVSAGVSSESGWYSGWP